ncbi:MAG: tRNA uridine-5-carboxymethylaminomethyl(34) synthesis GTPase MnmE [Lachnospiraceae bacterium]|nr:tRNA uridine-5-carboxymethylaminomethyl(34) synthesis GTPase MnmE [Lachnospiraceae bacterium]
MSEYNGDTICSIASGIGGAIGIIRVSGDETFHIVSQIFRDKNNNKVDVSKLSSHTIHYGYIFDDEEKSDEVLLLVMKAPNTYTREDVVEIDTHGGAFIMNKIMRLLIDNGAKVAEPGEFTKRAFLNGRIDLSQAESVMDIISSKNDYALHSSISQLSGSLTNYIEKIRKVILDDLSFIEAGLDDPEHISIDDYKNTLKTHLRESIFEIKKLTDKFNEGRLITQGINTVIVGKPNAGKSSILNLLLDFDRAIVTDIAGTTRDVIEEKVLIDNILLNLIDTAGIRETENLIENIGVEKTYEYIENADLIFYVIDSTEEYTFEDEEIIEQIKDKKGIILYNKTDLQSIVDDRFSEKLNWREIYFSAETKQGLDELKQAIKEEFFNDNLSFNDEVTVTSDRHYNAMVSAINSLQSVLDTIEADMPEDLYCIDMKDAYNYLGLINGNTATEDLINNIFKNFCMGK